MRTAWAAALLLVACEGVIDVSPRPGLNGGGGVSGTGAGSGAGGGSTGALGGDLPCELATLLTNQCTSCHGAVVSGGAPFSLVSRADLLREVQPGVTVADRSLVRMRQAAAPMPPSPFPPPAAADITVLDQWIANATPTGSCTGASADAGVVALTCLGQTTWTSGNLPSGDMNPGLACQACHAGRTGLEAQPERMYLFMGTVFRGPNEQNLCNAQLSGTVEIEIIGADHQVITRMRARNGSGNFFSDGERPMSDRLLLVGANVSLPYTVKVNANGRVREMKTPQMNGDCNECHTERATLAPGRIVVP